MLGDFSVSSKNGVIRPLDPDTKITNMIKNPLVLAMLSSGVGGVGSITSDILEVFKTIEFDTFNIKCQRNQSRDIRLQQLEILSETKRISGKGTLKYEESRGFLNWPVDVDLTFAAKGESAKLLSEGYLLTGGIDALGYYLGPTFKIDGNITNLDNNLGDLIREGIVRIVTGRKVEIPPEGSATKADAGSSADAISSAPQESLSPPPPPPSKEEIKREAIRALIDILGNR